MMRALSGRKTNPLSNERGTSAVLVAITITALLSAVALAVDVGMLLNSRSEAQRAADSAALAGAGSLIVAPDDEPRARNTAIQYGGLNTVRKTAVTVLPEDVDVDLAQGRVTARVRRTEDRGSAVATWFANVFGVSEVDIAATATAQVQPAGAATCVKPFAIPDQFFDVNGNGEFDNGIDQYDPWVHGYGSDWRNPGHPGADGQGYANDFGRQIDLKYGGPDDFQPSWYYPWNVPNVEGSPDVGADEYRWNIANCNPNIISIGELYQIETGDMNGPTRLGVEDLMGRDSDAYWDTFSNQVENSAWSPNWEGGPRIGIIPVFNPSRPFEPGKKPVEFTNFIAVFIEDVQGGGYNQQVIARIMYASGIGGGSGGTGPGVKFVQLVE
ncbi:MAG: pilus assembly protein TadG-related protein [Gemmatimonadota bacterium]|jgi:Flp pilus assembly protein TadG